MIDNNFLPYYDNREVINKIRRDYNKQHSHCPECGSDSTVQTLMGFPINPNDPESYKDENDARCKCGWKGIVHDLV